MYQIIVSVFSGEENISKNKKVKAASNTAFTLQEFVTLTCFFVSGFISLAYEICWIRKASLVFGTATFALSTVLAVFFAGLALGSYAFGKYALRTTRPLRLYAILEIGVGVLALLTPVAFAAADALYGRFYPLAFNNFAMLSFIRFVFIAIILLPTTVLMGGTLPLFCRQYVLSEKRISRSVGFLYGLNTLGAATGCAVCGFFMIPYIGVNRTIYLGGIMSILVGMVVWQLPLTTAPIPALMAQPGNHHTKRSASRLSGTPYRVTSICALFFLSGFVALGHEILWARYLSLLMYNTVYTYTLTLTVILVGIVLGSVLTARFFDNMRRRPLVFGAVQIVAGITILTVLMLPKSFWAYWLDPTGFHTRVWIVVLLLLFPSVLSGVSFPLAIRMVVDQPVQASIGVGTMTAVNMVGGIAGSLTIGFFLLPLLGLQATLLVTTGMSLFVGFAAWLLLERTVTPLLRFALIVLSSLIWLMVPFVTGVRLPADFLTDRKKLVDFREGLNSTMAIVRESDRLQLEIDRMWQGENRKGHQVMAAHIPMLLHPSPKHILVVGIGTGQTASRFLLYPIEQLDCVEIESKLIPLVKQYFESAWMTDERFRLIVEDGRNYLTHTSMMYDVISIEVGQIFRPGLASFYTADFYHRARRRLKQKGLLCQFVALTFFSPEEFRMVVRTFLDVFPQSVLWYNTSECLLIGTVGDELKLTANRLSMLTFDDALRQDLDFAYWGGQAYRLNRPEVFLAGFLAGPSGLAKLAEGAPVYQDDLPDLEYTTAQNRESFKIPSVELIRACLEPAQLILDMEPDSRMVSLSQSIREKNLRDIVAVAMNETAAKLLIEGRHQEAVAQFRQALQQNPDNINTHLRLAIALKSQGSVDEAIRHYRWALQIRPDSAKAHYNLAIALKSQGKLDEAIRHYRQALRINPDYAEAYYNLGVIYENLGRYQDAIEAYKKAIRIKPDYAEAYYNLGGAYANLGRYQDAIEAFKKATRIKPDYAEAYCNLGRAYGILGRWRDAIESSKQAIRIKPDFVEAHYNLGVTYENLGRYQDAIEAYKQAIRIKPDYAKAYYNLGVAYEKLGRYQDAIEANKKAIRIKPDLAEAHCNLGVAYERLGRRREAIEAFKKATRIKPDLAEAHYSLGIAYLAIGDVDSALEQYKILKTLDAGLANQLSNRIHR